MASAKKIELIYYDGQADGIRSIRRHLSTITAYVVPRSMLSEAKVIVPEGKQGVYYLINENDNAKIAQLYIGQTRNGNNRLDSHNRTKDFWNKAILFLADSKTFSLDIISGLEKYAIEKAKESKRYAVENDIEPKYVIDPFDLVLIEEIYEEIKFIMATQGYRLDSSAEELSDADVFHVTRRGVNARGIYHGDKFDVLEGSEVDLSRPANLKKYNIQRSELLAKHNIVPEGDKHILKVTLSFDSPSGAGEFVLGGSINGWIEWKNQSGQTLSDVYRSPET